MKDDTVIIPMVNLVRQYQSLYHELTPAITKVLTEANYINGNEVRQFSDELAQYLHCFSVVPCANGTDALQIALMTLGLSPGDEVIVPAFTYTATAEVVALLGLTPRFVDVEIDTFTLSPKSLEAAITKNTKAIIAVHLFGQCAEMNAIMAIANKYGLYVVEDNAQAIGAKCLVYDGIELYSGTIGSVGCTSFYPSKNLGCFGDGGALTFGKNNKLNCELTELAQQITNHGQKQRYLHERIGCNSRLDTLQASILRIKLMHLSDFTKRRQQVAHLYDTLLGTLNDVTVPARACYSTHVFHQYTIRVNKGQRDALKNHLQQNGIASMVYYPIPLHKQPAFQPWAPTNYSLSNSETLCNEVLSLPICPEITNSEVEQVAYTIKEFFKR